MSAAHKIAPSYKSKLEWLPVSAIEVDARIQRPIDRAWVTKLADNLDPDAPSGFPSLSRSRMARAATGTFYVDGQHRGAAVKQRLGDNQLLECEVIHGVTLQQAAKIFGQRNTQRPVKAVDRFLVGITQCDDECVAINSIVTSLGLTVSRGSQDGGIPAVAALQRIYRGDKFHGTRKNSLALKRTIVTALRAWGRTADAMNGAVIEGLGLVVLRYGDTLDFDALERKLRQFKGGALGLLGSARGLRESFGGSVANCVAHQVVLVYNRGRAKHQLGDWNRAKAEE